MTEEIIDAAACRSREIRAKARQYKLLFVQVGAAFDVLRGALISQVGGTQLGAAEFCETEADKLQVEGILVLTELEEFTGIPAKGRPTLGTLRQRVTQQLAVSDVCLISRAPRIAFPKVPGSSLIEDSKVHVIPLLESHEHSVDASPSGLPSVVFGDQGFAEAFRASLQELGLSTLAALDYALFESMSGRDFVRHLEHGEIEALRGAGLVAVEDGDHAFTVPRRYSEFREAAAGALAEITHPQDDLGPLADGLWTIERMIRKSLRDLAIRNHQGSWRRHVTHGDLETKVLQRARSDSYLTAAKVSELRDPIEWLSLGELLEVARSTKFQGLGIDEYTWSRFSHDLLPIRNRLSHMRLIKHGDRATVGMWVKRLSQLLSNE